MQRAALLVLIFLVSGLATLGIMGANIGSLPLNLPQASGPQPDKTKIDPQVRYATARILAASGRLREAQDEYLRILQTSPADSRATRELIAIRRRLAADDPALLRRQAAAYRQAIARRVETPEHYSRDSMELLAAASVQAAAAIESGSSVRKGVAVRQSLDLRPTPRPTPGAANPPTPAPTPPAASATAPAAPPAPQKPSPTPTGATSAAPESPPAQPPQPAPNAGIAVTPQPSFPPPPPASPAPPAAAAPPPPGADKPAAGQPAPAPAETQETVAVLTPPSEPPVTSSQGSLVKIDCQKHTFVLHDANGDEEYQTTPNVAIYIRGAQSQRLPEFCGLQSYLGHAVTAWTISGGDRRIAKEVSIAL